MTFQPDMRLHFVQVAVALSEYEDATATVDMLQEDLNLTSIQLTRALRRARRRKLITATDLHTWTLTPLGCEQVTTGEFDVIPRSELQEEAERNEHGRLVER